MSSFWPSFWPFGKPLIARIEQTIARIEQLRQKEHMNIRKCADRRDWDGTTYHEAKAEAFTEVLVMLRESAK